MAAPEFDVVVVGAGTAGSNVALQFSRRGRRVLLVDRRAADAAGARWRNGVLDRHFVAADLDPPAGPERVTEGGTVHLRGRDPRVGPTLHDAPVVGADMALLGERLRRGAVDAGTEVFDEVRSFDVDVDRTGRLRGLTLRRNGDAPRPVTAALFVDAAGRTGVLRRHAPDLTAWCPTIRGDELCSATDGDHAIVDRAGAERFLARYDARPGDSVTTLGVSGGFSTAAVTVSEDLGEVHVLVGCLADGRYGTGPTMVAALREREPWIGPAHHSGSGVIPLRRPYARTTAPGLALVGDAAAQVFPAHGSGIGLGLMAGTMLARGVADADDPGDAEVLWRGYQAPFQRRHGGELGAYDALRRASTRLGSDGVDALIASGVMDEHSSRAGLEQRWAPPPPAAGARSAARLLRRPALARVMVPALARAQLLVAHGRRHPDTVDLDALARWDERARTILGPLPR